MIRFDIVRQKIIKKSPIRLTRIDSNYFGKIDINDLNAAKFDPVLTDIPLKNQRELKEKGITRFSIVTKTVVTISKKPINGVPLGNPIKLD